MHLYALLLLISLAFNNILTQESGEANEFIAELLDQDLVNGSESRVENVEESVVFPETIPNEESYGEDVFARAGDGEGNATELNAIKGNDSIEVSSTSGENENADFRHNFSLSGITILDEHTLFLENFSYDGFSPDAHFYLNRKNLDFNNAVLITDELGQTSRLKNYHGQNITLAIEGNVFEYDFLSVWCTLDRELIGFASFHENGDVSSPYVIKTPPRNSFQLPTFDHSHDSLMIKTLTPFLNTTGGVSSGRLSVVNETAVFIPDFTIAVVNEDVGFYAGKGEISADEGQIVPLGESNYLPPINNQSILIVFPEGITVNDVDWLSVWNENETKSLGHVMFHSEVRPKYIQIPPLVQTEKYNYNIHSGPIVLIDTNTIFIANLHYDGKAPDAHFWTGTLELGHVLDDDRNSTQPLSAYVGEDVYLKLPDLDVRTISNVAIRSTSLKTLLAVSSVPPGTDLSVLEEGKGFHEYTQEGKYVARLPKCCPLHQVKTSKGCVNRITSTLPMRIYTGNLTIYDDAPLEDVIYEPYLYQPKCEYGMFRMTMSEEFYLLTVGLVIMPDGVIVSKDTFCYDVSQIVLDDDVLSWNETMFMCFETEHVPEFLNTLMVICIYISSFFLIITSAIFIIFKSARAERGTNVMGYTTMMSLSFGCLATARILHVTGTACTVLGFIYQFFLVSSFTWLLCLTCDVFYQVWWYERNYNKHRYKYFTVFAMGLPVVAVIISIFINSTIPTKYSIPTNGYQPCWLRSDKKVFFYYVPIAVSIILNFTFITITWYKIKQRQKNPTPLWSIRGKEIKNIFRSCYLILGIMTICWTAEIVSYYFETNNGLWVAIDVIDSLQGVFVFLVFVMHEPVIQIMKTQCAGKKETGTEDLYMSNITPIEPNEHGALLGKLQHAESVEDLCNLE